MMIVIMCWLSPEHNKRSRLGVFSARLRSRCTFVLPPGKWNHYSIIHVQDLTNHVAMFGRNTHAAILHLGILLKFSVVIFEVMLEVVIFVKQRGRWDHQACQNIFLARIFYMTEYWPILSLNGRDNLNHKFEESDKVVRSREYEDGDDE